MTILLLRHAKAGDRAAWQGDDRLRPVSSPGRRQAEAIVRQLADRPIERLLTSPYTRCVETVEPLAAARGLPIEEDEDLAEGMPLDAVRRLLRRLTGTHALLCTHGDIVEAVVTDLWQRGVDVGPEPRWRKGSTWLLDGDPDRPVATYLPPPA